jgi:hypothetical protein
MDRRTFAGTLASVTAGLAARPRLEELEPGALPARRLGTTDLLVPILGLGGFHVGQAGSAAQARELVAAALDEGIRLTPPKLPVGDPEADRRGAQG